MKAKKKYRIGCRDVSIVWVNKEMSEDVLYLGKAHYDLDLIKLTIDDLHKMDTLLHEVIHLILDEHKIEATEMAVKVVATHIIAFVRDNNLDLREELEP